MYACCGTPLFLLDLAPAGVAGDRPQHPGGSACSPCSGETSAVVLTMSSAPRLLSLLLVNSPGSRPCCVVPLSCTEAFHLAHSCLSGGIALHIGAHSIYSCEGVSSSSTYTTILDLLLRVFNLNFFFFWIVKDKGTNRCQRLLISCYQLFAIFKGCKEGFG